MRHDRGICLQGSKSDCPVIARRDFPLSMGGPPTLQLVSATKLFTSYSLLSSLIVGLSLRWHEKSENAGLARTFPVSNR